MTLLDNIKAQLEYLEEDVKRFKQYSSDDAVFTYSQQLLQIQVLELKNFCAPKKQQQKNKNNETEFKEYDDLLARLSNINYKAEAAEQKAATQSKEIILDRGVDIISHISKYERNDEKLFAYRKATLFMQINQAIDFIKSQQFKMEEEYKLYNEIKSDLEKLQPDVSHFTRHAISQLQQSQDAKQHMKPIGSNMTQKQIINNLLHNNRILTLVGKALLAENRRLNNILMDNGRQFVYRRSMTVAYNQTVQQQAVQEEVLPATTQSDNVERPSKRPRIEQTTR